MEAESEAMKRRNGVLRRRAPLSHGQPEDARAALEETPESRFQAQQLALNEEEDDEEKGAEERCLMVLFRRKWWHIS